MLPVFLTNSTADPTKKCSWVEVMLISETGFLPVTVYMIMILRTPIHNRLFHRF